MSDPAQAYIEARVESVSGGVVTAKAADGRTFAVDLQLPLQPPSRKQKEARGRVTNVRARALLRQGMVEADEETRPKKVIAP